MSLHWSILLLVVLASQKITAKSVISDISDDLVNLFKIAPKEKKATQAFIKSELKEMMNMTEYTTISAEDDAGGLHQRGFVNFAYNKDVNNCLFDKWVSKSILSNKVDCKGGAELCYHSNPSSSGSSSKPVDAQFAVCYNILRRIPDFTGHVVQPRVSVAAAKPSGKKTARPKWIDERGIPSSSKDYTPSYQGSVFPEYSEKDNQFVNRGHLTPNGDFDQPKERDQTFIISNAAPQWALFNAGNWASLEDGVRDYATKNKRNLYVFTGTGGEAKNKSTGAEVKIGVTKDVIVPEYFWKAICDPGVGSVIFVGENPVGYEKSATQVKPGCAYTGKTTKNQKVNQGVLYCYSLDDARSQTDYQSFKDLFPPFDSSTCLTGLRGEFIDVKGVTV